MNRYPAWKYVLIAILLLIGTLYALPNLFGDDPSVQVSNARGLALADGVQTTIEDILELENLSFTSIESDDRRVLVRFNNTDTQIRANDVLSKQLGNTYTTALSLSPATPAWLRALGATPMVLGLDLQGGLHFLMEVDMDTAERQLKERYVDDFRALLREEGIHFYSINFSGQTVTATIRNAEQADQAIRAIRQQSPELQLTSSDADEGGAHIRATISDETLAEIKQTALQQNITTIRNRVNETGVAEPIVQQQGGDRIVVQLPGVQDSTTAKRILSATATLEYRAVDMENDAIVAQNTGRVPPTSRLYYDRGGNPVLLNKRLIASGDQLIGANAGFDQQTGSPMVSVTLDGVGAKRMLDFTTDNVGNFMAVVVYIEERYDPELDRNRRVEEVISNARINGVFGKRFQTTGLASAEEATQLALLLRSGALAAPIRIIEERTVGPSLGQDNINQGFKSVIIGFVLVLVFMVIYYRLFGVFANMALTINLVLMVAVLSLFGATLTLPGIAGIVLTVGMAVDANVLIFERIREELRNGNSPQNSIRSGYDKAFSTIADANVTTLIAAVALLAFGTGPIRGFAVTLSVGIVTSMFTAIMVTRAIVNWHYGRRQRIEKLSI